MRPTTPALLPAGMVTVRPFSTSGSPGRYRIFTSWNSICMCRADRARTLQLHVGLHFGCSQHPPARCIVAARVGSHEPADELTSSGGGRGQMRENSRMGSGLRSAPVPWTASCPARCPGRQPAAPPGCCCTQKSSLQAEGRTMAHHREHDMLAAKTATGDQHLSNIGRGDSQAVEQAT